jgi:hypothetical protein
MNTSVKAPFSSQLDQLTALDPTSAEAIALIWAMLVQHSESLDDLDRQDLQTFVDIIDSVSSKRSDLYMRRPELTINADNVHGRTWLGCLLKISSRA